MYFVNFEIKNFKGIKEINLPLSEIKDAGQIHTLVGLNESGKTTILEAINAFSRDGSRHQDIFEEIASKKDAVTDYVPKDQKANFTGQVSIKATLSLEARDLELLEKYMLDELDFILDKEKSSPQITINKTFSFKNSDYEKTSYFWGIKLFGKKKRGTKEIVIDTRSNTPWENTLWEKTIYFIEDLIPSISYFPTFLFDFPEKIYLEETEHETKPNKYYRDIIQDILDSLDQNLNIQTHIVNRVYDQADDGGVFFNPMKYFMNSNTKDQIDSVLLQIGDKVTEIVFETWNDVFDRRLQNKDIKIEFGIEPEEYSNDQRVYLQFKMKDGSSTYSISERSLGFRWFFCFLLFTYFRGFRKADRNALFLFDEPASNLHSGAQNQLLDSLPKITKGGCSIIYSTHSHHLINPRWLENTFIVQNLAVDYDNENEEPRKGTCIELYKYKTFVGRYPDKQTYFQPILEKLEYKPSRLENVPNVVIFEGKHDYYTFSYFSQVILDGSYEVNYMPGTGANDLDALLSLYLGWGKTFIIILDADNEGVKAKQRYQDEWFLNENQVFTLADIDESWNKCKLEDLFVEQDRIKIMGESTYDKKKFKKTMARFLQEKTLSGEKYAFEEETINNFEKVIKFSSSMLEKQI